MKITINTSNKTITLLESCKFSEVASLIENLGGDWNIEIRKENSNFIDKLLKENKYKKDNNNYKYGPGLSRSYNSTITNESLFGKDNLTEFQKSEDLITNSRNKAIAEDIKSGKINGYLEVMDFGKTISTSSSDLLKRVEK